MSDTSEDGLKFGTSGLRGPAHLLDGAAAGRWTQAFLSTMRAGGHLHRGAGLLIARDRRPSSAAISARVAGAAERFGLAAIDCGELPTPALALAAITRRLPAVMVTGSHIPGDRNGLKFYRPDGEIDKADETAIVEAERASDDLGEAGQARPDPQAAGDYAGRITRFFATDTLAGLKVGVWAHSSVAAPLLSRVLQALGAEVVVVGETATFLALDTEALGAAETAMLRDLSQALKLDALVSTDPDGDRPLVVDETGRMIPGDLLGAAVAAELGIRTIVTPVSSNSALVPGARFDAVHRTKIGSPYVLAALAKHGDTSHSLAGFEANGGFILASDVVCAGRRLGALPTRDALLPIVTILAALRGSRLSTLTAGFGFRARRSTRIEHVSSAASSALIAALEDAIAADGALAVLGTVTSVDRTDGLRVTLDGTRIVHFRPSGNAPELRIYVEAADDLGAEALERAAIALAGRYLAPGDTP